MIQSLTCQIFTEVRHCKATYSANVQDVSSLSLHCHVQQSDFLWLASGEHHLAKSYQTNTVFEVWQLPRKPVEVLASAGSMVEAREGLITSSYNGLHIIVLDLQYMLILNTHSSSSKQPCTRKASLLETGTQVSLPKVTKVIDRTRLQTQSDSKFKALIHCYSFRFVLFCIYFCDCQKWVTCHFLLHSIKNDRTDHLWQFDWIA